MTGKVYALTTVIIAKLTNSAGTLTVVNHFYPYRYILD